MKRKKKKLKKKRNKIPIRRNKMSNRKKSTSIMSRLFIIALVAVFAIILIMLMAGGRYAKQSGLTFVGFVTKAGEDTVPKSGTIYYSDGMTAKVTDCGFTVTFSDGTVVENAVKLEFASGDVYEGKIRDYRMNGKGKYTWSSEDCYEGDFVSDAFTGKGTLYYSEGEVYIGEFTDGMKNGKGVFLWNDCDTSDLAAFNYDAIMAQGENLTSLTAKELPAGTWYVGTFANNDKSGKGVYHHGSEDVYVGNFSNNGKNGKGKFFFAKGDIYDGDYKDDVISGTGTYLWDGGDKYEGEFAEGAMNGKGKYTKADGKVIEGTFVNNEHVSDAEESKE